MAGATSDLEGLRAFDSNGDGILSASDGNVITAFSSYTTSDGESHEVADVAFAYIDKNGNKKHVKHKKDTSALGPVVFDLQNDGIDLIEASESDVMFDADDDGIKESVGWIGENEAFLALDRNGNGNIDSGAEISFIGDFAGATTDLEGLVGFDSNGDGMLDANDDRFADFLMWQDKNRNGISEADEPE